MYQCSSVGLWPARGVFVFLFNVQSKFLLFIQLVPSYYNSCILQACRDTCNITFHSINQPSFFSPQAQRKIGMAMSFKLWSRVKSKIVLFLCPLHKCAQTNGVAKKKSCHQGNYYGFRLSIRNNRELMFTISSTPVLLTNFPSRKLWKALFLRIYLRLCLLRYE